MFSMVGFVRLAAVAAVLAATALPSVPARAEDEFPFGMTMTLDTAPQPGSKRLPNLEIGDNGEASLELWCKGGKGQFSVAGNTVIFVAGQFEDRACPPAKAQADDALIAALGEAGTWKRQGDLSRSSERRRLRFCSIPTEPAGRFYFQADLSESQRWPLNSFASASTEPLSSVWSPSSSPLTSAARFSWRRRIRRPWKSPDCRSTASACPSRPVCRARPAP